MSTVRRRLLRQDIYEAVLTQVVEGHLAPGARVRDTAIAQQLDVSRTPVREALVRLSQDGFLEADAGRGFRVRRMDPGEVRELYPIVAMLECLALESSVPLDDVIGELTRLNQRIAESEGDAVGRIRLDEEWHELLLAKCPNRMLLSMIGSLKQRIRVYEYYYWRKAGLAEVSTEEHSGIIEALETNDLTTAKRLLRRQFDRSVDRIAKSLE